MVATNDPAQGADKDFVEYVVKQIVQFPDKVVVTREIDEMGVLITLQVAREDMGKVIGKSGQTAKAVRILLRVIGSKNNARVNLKIVEPEGGSMLSTPAAEGEEATAAPAPTIEGETDLSGDIKL
jgi:uncharacterized protein